MAVQNKIYKKVSVTIFSVQALDPMHPVLLTPAGPTAAPSLHVLPGSLYEPPTPYVDSYSGAESRTAFCTRAALCFVTQSSAPSWSSAYRRPPGVPCGPWQRDNPSVAAP